MSSNKVLMFLTVGLLAIVPAACGGDSAADQAALDREMDLAMTGDSATAELADVPAGEPDPGAADAPDPSPSPRETPRPQPEPDRAAPAPQPAPSPAPKPAYELVPVSAGTRIVVVLNQELSTKTNQVGDIWSGTVQQPITDGRRVIIPAGARVIGEVTAVQESKGSGQSAILKLSVDEMSIDGRTYAMAGSIVEANPTTKGRQSSGEKAAKIGGAGALGGIIGGVIGGNVTGAVIGAAVGAAAGTAITLGTEDVDAVLAEGSEMTVQVDEDFDVRWSDT